MTGSLRLTESGSVSDVERADILDLHERAVSADGVSALDDQVRLDLAHSSPDTAARHVLAHRGETLVGYAHFRRTAYGPMSAHLVVDSQARREGVGSALVEHLLGAAGDAGVRVWAHGDVASAALLGDRFGFRRDRELWQLRRPLDDSLPEPTYPADVRVRTFEVGRDEDAWVAVNAAAFEDHPEQGAMTRDDLLQRMDEPWFDPEGLFVATRGDTVVGFHWTRVHPAGEKATHQMGEVYAVGVSPAAQGLGLGKALTLTGLLYLRERGLTEVLLYVDADNTAAVATYRGLGFSSYAVDVMYESSGLPH